VDAHPNIRDPEMVPAEDYGYDLAHEATEGTGAGPAHPARSGVSVAMQTDDEGGDYGYDLAHDVPTC
jgi:hypothetical protein